jgi:AcrR family transcriptional regulator
MNAQLAPLDPTEDKRPVADHRHRVARERRARMRERLIAATMEVYRQSAGRHRPVIDDVIRAANVSRGTFYKYFDTLDEVLSEIGHATASEMLQSFERLFETLEDGAVMLATGPLMALTRAAMDPTHGAIVSHADLVDRISGDDPRRQLAFRSLRYGREQGVFQFDSIEAAFDLVIGASVEGARRISRTGQLDGACIRETVVMILLGLGMKLPGARLAVTTAWRRLQDASEHLHWWKPVTAV